MRDPFWHFTIARSMAKITFFVQESEFKDEDLQAVLFGFGLGTSYSRQELEELPFCGLPLAPVLPRCAPL